MYVESSALTVKKSSASRSIRVEWMGIDGQTTRALDENWFLDVALAKCGFSPVSLSSVVADKISKVIADGRKTIIEKLRIIDEPEAPFIRSIIASISVDYPGPLGVFMRNHPPTILVRTANNCFLVAGGDAHDCRYAISELTARITSLQAVAKGIGFEIGNPRSGPKFVLSWLKSRPTVKNIVMRQASNDFEVSVARVMRRMTGSFIANPEIVFEDPYESHEYDLIVALDPNWALDIEIMDYHNAKELLTEDPGPFKNNWKSSILLRTMDRAARLGQHTHLVIILRGFNKALFNQMHEIAKSRGVVLLDDDHLAAKLWLLMQYSSIAVARRRPSIVAPTLRAYDSHISSVNWKS